MMDFNYPPGATPLDPNEIEGLKLKHISTRAELDRWEQDNIQDAIAWLSKRRKSDILTEDFIRQLHRKMFGKVWKWAGEFRRTEKNIGVPWVNISIELKTLLDDVKYWIEHQTYPPEEIAYRFHHRLVLIHLFPNGNGRHARLMTDILLNEVFGIEPFTWGSRSLTNAGKARDEYIRALRAADGHNFALLEQFVIS